jgi:pyruvate dehydrogenase E2 component (dihydrolipoamide acetyltransferase)
MKLSKIVATPAARRIAREKGIDLSLVPGSGNLGSIVAADVNSFRGEKKVTPVAREMAGHYQLNLAEIKTDDAKIAKRHIEKFLAVAAGTESPQEDILLHTEGAGRVVPMQGMRKVIAERMTESLRAAPQYTLCAELDSTNLLALLKDTKAVFAKLTGAKLTFTDILVKITALAIMKHPEINSSIKDDKIICHDHVNMGIAVALDEGLIVPVIKKADSLSLREINTVGQDLIARARKGKLLPDDYSGGTFTISNLGMYPVDFSTPIINQPESAILGVGRTVEKPVVINGEITVRSMTGFSLTLDHRSIDGAVGAAFLATFNEFLTNPLCVLV